MRRLTEDEVRERIRAKHGDSIELLRYGGGMRAVSDFRCRSCGNEWSTAAHNATARTGCPRCSYARSGDKQRFDPAEAVAIMRSKGLEPKEDYPGSQVGWLSECLGCGQDVRPRFTHVYAKGQSGCRACAMQEHGESLRREYAEAAVADMLAAGADPLEPYPGTAMKWRCRCTTCNREITPTHSNVARGQRPCAYCARRKLDIEEAVQVMHSVGLEPQTDFPGSAADWPSICMTCGRLNPTSKHVTAKAGCGCAWCARNRVDPVEVEGRIRALGGEPLDPYPGATEPWRIRHECGYVVTPTWNNIKTQQRIPCSQCYGGYDMERPARLYVVAHLDLYAVKVGVTTAAHNLRLAQYRAHGWRLVTQRRFDTGREARLEERRILAEWRDQGIPEALTAEDMPMGGWTETAPLSALPGWELLLDAS